MQNKTKPTRSTFWGFQAGRAIGKATAVLAGVLLLSGCTSRLGDYTIISTKNMDLNNPYGFAADTNHPVEGEDLQHIIFFVPTQLNVNLKEAVDRAIEKRPGCVGLSNVVVYFRSFWFIYGQNAFVVKGDPIYSKAPVGAPAVQYPQPQYAPAQPQYAPPQPQPQPQPQYTPPPAQPQYEQPPGAPAATVPPR